MKTFFASLLGTLAAIVLMLCGLAMVFFVMMAAAAALGQKPVEAVEPDSFLVFDLGANITDAPAQFDDSAFMAAFSGRDQPDQLQLRLVTRALREAATDDRILGVVLRGSLAPSGYGTSFAALQEVRRALETVREAGKPVHAFLQYPDTRDFYLASVANDLALDPNGLLLMPGLAAETMFYTGLFERFGVGVQTVQAGAYKSGVEPFTRRDYSPENREQLQVLLDGLWTELRDTVAETRDVEPAQFQALVDEGRSFIAADVLAAGLVDRVIYVDEMLADLKRATGVVDPTAPFTQVDLTAYVRQMRKINAAPEEQPAEAGTAGGRVAVVYAEGVIVDGEGGPMEIGGTRFAREIRELRQDDSVKAIVLRVNSPGGSATASEHIQRELRLAAETMPVVVSMGGYAASGGYWISAYGSRIFAEPMTITGSIGAYGMLANFEKLGHDLGLTWDRVKTGVYADAASGSRPKTEAEMALFERLLGETYEQFLAKVAEGRGMPLERVRELAGGRVWHGAAAQELGLVDELGGLADAIAYAAGQAGLRAGFRISEYPRHKDFAEMITEALQRFQPTSASGGVAAGFVRQLEDAAQTLGQFNDPQGIYARMPADLRIN